EETRRGGHTELSAPAKQQHRERRVIARLEILLLVVGLLIVLYAYGRYVHRTGDWRGLLVFWRRRLALSVAEFKLQRAGIAVMFLAVVVRIVRTIWLV